MATVNATPKRFFSKCGSDTTSEPAKSSSSGFSGS